MSTYHLRRYRITIFIATMVAIVLSLSVLSAQTGTASNHLMPVVSGNSAADDSVDTSMILTTEEPSPTPTLTNTPRPTTTYTPFGPFDCSLLSLSSKRLSGNQVKIDIQND